jgi:hypothetical protein
MKQQRKYRTREQWQSIIDDFDQSTLSAPAYCEQNNIPYGSFAKWRPKLSEQSGPLAPSSEPPAFLDLSALSPTDNAAVWHITLKLGNGVELVLSQA